MATTQLLIFAKYPQPGDVMTRLCPPLAPTDAADIQRACIRLLCERAFRAWPVCPKLVISPDDSEERFREIVGPYIPMLPQGDGDLGERLTRATRAAGTSGEVLIIGSDSPTLPTSTLVQAGTLLAESDVVVGPCDDGGFYLVGLKRPADGLFEGIDWSTNRACAQLAGRARERGLTVAETAPWYDVDRVDDLARAVEDLHREGHVDATELLRVIEFALKKAGRKRSKVNK